MEVGSQKKINSRLQTSDFGLQTSDFRLINYNYFDLTCPDPDTLAFIFGLPA